MMIYLYNSKWVKFMLYYPSISRVKMINNRFRKGYSKFEISLDTGINLESTFKDFRYSIKLLGFGFGMYIKE